MKNNTAFGRNNEGASLIESGNYNEASQMLCKALRLIRHDGKSSSSSIEKSETSLKECQIQDKFRDPDEPFVYSNPVFLQKKSTDSAGISMTILFNLAIANHLRAMKDENNSNARLQRALKLYELVYAIQNTNTRGLPLTQCLGLVNNCGHIHKQLNREAKANRLFQHLLTTLMLMVQQGEEIPEAEGFFSTTSHLILQGPAAARAA
jgi:tetratricopeptide (TPR) repeat protein